MNKYYYPAVFQKEDGGFSVWMPDVPGCISQGDTLEGPWRTSKMHSDCSWKKKKKMVEKYKRRLIRVILSSNRANL